MHLWTSSYRPCWPLARIYICRHLSAFKILSNNIHQYRITNSYTDKLINFARKVFWILLLFSRIEHFDFDCGLNQTIIFYSLIVLDQLVVSSLIYYYNKGALKQFFSINQMCASKLWKFLRAFLLFSFFNSHIFLLIAIIHSYVYYLTSSANGSGSVLSLQTFLLLFLRRAEQPTNSIMLCLPKRRLPNFI